MGRRPVLTRLPAGLTEDAERRTAPPAPEATEGEETDTDDDAGDDAGEYDAGSDASDDDTADDDDGGDGDAAGGAPDAGTAIPGDGDGDAEGWSGDAPYEAPPAAERRITEPPPVVTLELLNHHISVRDGETIGREIRRVMVAAGEPADEAAGIHREHARIEQDGETVFLQRLGENSLAVNGRRLERDERIRLVDGDAVTFSDTVTATVRVPALEPDSPQTPPLALESPAPVISGGEGASGIGLQRSLDTLINTIPGEVLVLWAALEGAAELYTLPLWAYWVFLAITVIATPVYVHRSIDTPSDPSLDSDSEVRWWQEANVRWQSLSATGAFLVWVYYLGGPFELAGLQQPAVATVVVILYPVLVVISPYYGSLLLYLLSNPARDRRDKSAAH